MVGRLVEQQHVGLGHPDAGEQRHPLPAAAQRLHRPLAQSSGTSSESSTTSTRQLSLSACSGGMRRRTASMECWAEERGGNVLLDIADAQAARAGDVADVGSSSLAMQRNSVDLPRPLAATMPSRSPARSTRLRLEKSGARRSTPRDLQIDQGHCRLWLSAGPRHRCGSWQGNGMSLVAMPAEHEARHCTATKGRPKRIRLGVSSWSALQTHLQGVDRAAMTAVIKELDHAAPPFRLTSLDLP